MRGSTEVEHPDLFALADLLALLDGHLARPLGTKTERSSLFDGTIYDKPRRECDKEIIRRVEELAKKKGWKMSEVGLAWIDGKVDSPIVGCSSVSRKAQSILPRSTTDGLGCITRLSGSNQPSSGARRSLKTKLIISRSRE